MGKANRVGDVFARFYFSRDYSDEPIVVNHRDTRNTEKTKNSVADIDSLNGDFPVLTPLLVFLCVHRVSVVLASVSTA